MNFEALSAALSALDISEHVETAARAQAEIRALDEAREAGSRRLIEIATAARGDRDEDGDAAADALLAGQSVVAAVANPDELAAEREKLRRGLAAIDDRRREQRRIIDGQRDEVRKIVREASADAFCELRMALTAAFDLVLSLYAAHARLLDAGLTHGDGDMVAMFRAVEAITPDLISNNFAERSVPIPSGLEGVFAEHRELIKFMEGNIRTFATIR